MKNLVFDTKTNMYLFGKSDLKEQKSISNTNFQNLYNTFYT